jgi:hypothetical protein
MFFNADDELNANPAITKLVSNGYMILEYQCPIEVIDLDLLLERHFITYFIRARKTGLRAIKRFR